MRARDFLTESDEAKSVTINIPITITIPAGGGMPSVGTIAAPAGKDLPDDPVYVSPLQQELELLKQQGGKKSKIINQIVRDDGADSKLGDSKDYFDLSEDYDELQGQFDQLIEHKHIDGQE
jgi:hypothetical protein